MAIGVGISQKQTAGMVPEHLLGKAILKMGLQELQEFVMAEFNENPALIVEEDRACAVCGSPLTGTTCSTCGAEMVTDIKSEPGEQDDWDADQWTSSEGHDDLDFEPFSVVASPCSLDDHLRAQIRASISPEDVPVAEFIIDLLDEEGYLREPLFDIATHFGMSVPQLETILVQVQSFDPPGIAATSLQDCLLIQLRQLDEKSEDKSNAEVIVRDYWDIVSKMKLDEVASKMKITRRQVESALLFVRDRLNPYPANAFRDPWQPLAPRREAKMAPDIAIRTTEMGLIAEVVDPISSRITLDEIYSTLYAEMSKKKNGFSDADRDRIKECLLSARSLVEALEFRKSTLRIIANELLRCQMEFFLNGPERLKPITRKQISEQVGLHESTISRATQDKTIQLPSGEVIPLEVLFDAALPVKEMVRKYAAERKNGKPLSDSEIAARLQADGIQVARRTVAKYREQLRLLSHDYRLG